MRRIFIKLGSNRPGGEDVGFWQPIEYEKMPGYCLTCRKQGHSAQESRSGGVGFNPSLGVTRLPQGPTGPKFVFACGSGASNAKSQRSGPIPTPQSQVVRQPIAQGQAASTGAKELTRPAQGASETPFNFNFDINMQGLNAKQRKRLRCKLRKQKGKSVVVDKSPEVGTSGAQPELSTGGTEGPLPNPAGKLPPIPEGSERTPAPTSSIQTDLDRPQQVLFTFTPLNPARFMGPLEIGTPPCTPPSDRDSGDTQRNSPVVPGGPWRTRGRSYSDSDVPRAGQEASLGGSGFDTDQEPYPDQHFRPALILRDSFVKGAPPLLIMFLVLVVTHECVSVSCAHSTVPTPF
nr:ABC transporter F family member 4-like [Ipomoea batatas]